MSFLYTLRADDRILRSIAIGCSLALCACTAGDDTRNQRQSDSARDAIAGGANSIWIEAESASSVDAPWKVEDDTVGFSGTGYLFNTSDIALARTGGETTYEFEVEEPGEYLAIIRGRRDNQGSCTDEEYDKCNDVRTAWNGGSFEKTLVKGPWGCWIWETRIETEREGEHIFTRNTAVLDRGKNTFHLGVRSNGVKVDVILIHRIGDPLPTGPFTEHACPETISLADAVELRGRPLPVPAD